MGFLTAKSLIVLIVLSVLAPATAFPAAADGGAPAQQRLFRALGIIPLPAVEPPDDSEFEDLDGGRIGLADFRGKVVLLNFWTTWCPSCRFEMPSMERLHLKLREKDFVILAVSLQEPPKRVKEFIAELRLSFLTVLDRKGAVGVRFGVFSIPTTFILDKAGAVIGKAVGARPWDGEDSVALFELLAGEAGRQGSGAAAPEPR